MQVRTDAATISGTGTAQGAKARRHAADGKQRRRATSHEKANLRKNNRTKHQTAPATEREQCKRDSPGAARRPEPACAPPPRDRSAPVPPPTYRRPAAGATGPVDVDRLIDILMGGWMDWWIDGLMD